MSENKKAHPAAATVGQANGTDIGGQCSHDHFKGILTSSQGSVISLIGTGRDSAVPRLRLAELTGLNERVVRALIQAARLKYVPIISFRGGYYLSDSSADLRRFARAMARRAAQINKVAIAMCEAADRMDGQQTFESWNGGAE